jgi:hypothetical protein
MCNPDLPEKSMRIETENSKLVLDAGKIHLDPANSMGRGIISDIKTTVGSHWRSEMTNLNQKTVAVTLLLFISVIAPTLTFGAVYGKVTDGNMGAVEMLLGTSWVGVTYALLGGMPTCIMGSTGPLLAFTVVIYNFAESMDVPFLTLNAWVSVWLGFFACTAAFFDLTRLVKLATRFTDEIFAFLIVTIFVMDALGDPFSNVGILRYMDPNHPSHQDQPDDYNYLATGLLSIILGLGTTGLTFFFRSFRYSSYFCSDLLRESLYDFAVTLAVITCTFFAIVVFNEIELESLSVPDSFEPTYACCTESCTTFWPDDCEDQAEAFGTRSWFVDYGDINGKAWVPFAAAGPAALAFVLIFLDNGITWHLINHPSHNLQHGDSYNWDLCLSGIFNLINGMMGLPWLVATTVPCIIHLNGLATKTRTGTIISVQETRLTSLFAHLIMGLSLLVLPVLRLLPLPVLYGVFLFMGLSSLPNIQFWNRVLLFFQQPSKYPKTVITEYVEKKRIHLYTCLQILFFCGVFVVQNIPAIAIIFPLMTLACIPARMFLFPRIFAGWELLLLDGDDDMIAEWVEKKERALGQPLLAKIDSSEMGAGAPEPHDEEAFEEELSS